MADFHHVPILDVLTDNCQQIWPAILLAIKSATFVAIDMELSGLGDRKKLNARSIDDRYEGMCEVARSRSVLSVGLSCFKLKSHSVGVHQVTGISESEMTPTELKLPRTTELDFQVQTFNIMLLCSEDYMVEPVSLKFLVEHGFDFNKQYDKGIPYYRGNDKKASECKDKSALLIRKLFTDIIVNEVPIVFHNAMVDLVFLYQSFYANLPAKISSFLADLSEMFPNGIYDTKYITEFKARYPASYLEYVFRRCQRDNHKSADVKSRHIKISYLKYPENMLNMSYLPCGVIEMEASSMDKQGLCVQFANHGWCPNGTNCLLSHDVDKVLDNEHIPHAKRRRKRKRKNKHNQMSDQEGPVDQSTEDTTDDISNSPCDVSMESDIIEEHDELPAPNGEAEILPASIQDVHSSRTEGHRAGFDSFMTGFIYATFIAKHGRFRSLPETVKTHDLGMQDFNNRVALSGKDIPLQIMKSNFAKTSKEHMEKLMKIKQ